MSPDSHCTILIVDDEPSLLGLCQLVLTREGYCLLAANGGEDALRAIQSQNVQLALLDVMMPGMNGVELAERLQQRDSNIRVLFMSAYSPKDIAELRSSEPLGSGPKAIHGADSDQHDRKCACKVRKHLELMRLLREATSINLRLTRCSRRPQSCLKICIGQLRQETKKQIVLLTDLLGKLVKLSE